MRRCCRPGCTNPVGQLGTCVCGACAAKEAGEAARREKGIVEYVRVGFLDFDELLTHHARFSDWLVAHHRE